MPIVRYQHNSRFDSLFKFYDNTLIVLTLVKVNPQHRGFNFSNTFEFNGQMPIDRIEHFQYWIFSLAIITI